MKDKSKKFEILLGCGIAAIIGCAFYSCDDNDDENLSALQENGVSCKSEDIRVRQFKKDLFMTFHQQSTRNGNLPHLTIEQIDHLQESSVNMLKAGKVYSPELEKHRKKGDFSLILAGTIYLCFTESTQTVNMNPSEPCFSWDRVYSCFITAAKNYVAIEEIKAILSIATNRCVTSAVVKAFIEKAIGKLGGLALDAAIEITYGTLSCLDLI